MDDRQYQKIVRFRCDAPEKPFFRKGILGVMGLEKSAVGDFEEDHAVIAVRKLDSFLNRLCTPLGRQSRPLAADIALKEHVRKCTRTFAADGASKERRALLLATKELFPNVVLLLRDPAHALRIVVKDPLHFDSLFGEVWDTLFDKRHALVPVMNSQKWQDLLQNIQRVVLRMPCESRPLAVVLKHLRFAKQRFDSSADPVAKVAFMLLPLATMLAYIGSDERHKPCDRERAKTLLKKLDSKFALAIGVSADWGLVTQAFLRIFDKSAHDIAKTDSEIRAFEKLMRVLFDQGAVFSSRSTEKSIRPTQLPAIGGYFGTPGVKPMFVTEHIEKMLRQRAVFNCGSEQVLLWGAPKAADVKEISERLKFITAHVIDRVGAELGHLSHFSCFDVLALRAAYGCTDPGEAITLQQAMQRHLRRVAQDLHVDEVTAAKEYRQVALLILDVTSPGRPLATASNSEVWQAMLEPNITLSNLPQLSAMRCLHVLIRFYISIEDGECAVERDLGVLSKFAREHNTGSLSGELADDSMLARSDPIAVGDICVGGLAVGSCPRLGPRARRWATLWRAMYGARLGCYRKLAQDKRRTRTGSYTAAKVGALAAAEYAVAADAQHTGHQGREEDGKSALGDKGKAYDNAKVRRFAVLTKLKQTGAQPVLSRMVARLKAFKPKRAGNIAEKLERIKAVCYVGEAGESLPHAVAETQAGLKEASGRKRSLHADLAVVDDLGRLFDCPDDATVGHVLAIAARGLPVITRAAWVLAEGDPGRVPQASVLRHRPLAEEMKVVFKYGVHFQARAWQVLKTLEALSAPNLPDSKWKIRSPAVGGPISAGADSDKGYEVVELIDVGDLRSWLQRHRRILNVMGSKAWSLTQPVF